MKKPDFVPVNTDSWKLIVDSKILGWAWSKMGVPTLVSRLENLLYLKNESME